MPKTIGLPDGSNGIFPDDMSDDAITAVLRKQYQSGAQQYRVGDTSKPAGYIEQFVGGAKHEWDREALGVEGAAKVVVGAKPDPANVENVQHGREFVQQTGPASTAGQITANIGLNAIPAAKGAKVLLGALGKLGRAAPTVANIASNAGVSAATAPEDRGTAALAGGAGAAGGQVLNRTLGGIVRPSETGKEIMDAGAPLTPGQAGEGIMGRVAKLYEHYLGKAPIMGYPVRAAQRAGIPPGEAKEAVGPLDQTLRGLLTKKNIGKVAAELGVHKASGGLGTTAGLVSLLGTTEPGRKFLLGQMSWQEVVKAHPEFASQIGRALADQAQGE